MNSAAGEPQDDILLRTKLHRPPVPADLVRRSRLVDLLGASRRLPLTLVSAPAGFGNSVLISSWLQDTEWPSAWLSLDADDSDLRQFLMYFIAAVRSVSKDACEHSWNLARSSELPSPARIATMLANAG
jgi:LuxR family maltose regulon positive regulatory protein